MSARVVCTRITAILRRPVGWKTIVGLVLAVIGFLGVGGCFVMRMPGRSFHGTLPPTTEDEFDVESELKRHVHKLAGEIGERNILNRLAYQAAADYIEAELRSYGYEVERQTYNIDRVVCTNLIAERRGSRDPNEIIVIGAHYDSVYGSPGANDNGSGVAAMLALAKGFADRETARTIRFVAFANEEPPNFQTKDMGSWVYAKRCRDRSENIVAMLSLETIGYYSDQPGSQAYPFPFSLFYPSTGDFIGFVGNLRSRPLLHKSIGAFRATTQFPSEGAAMPPFVATAGWSDHWSFWQHGYPAVMITDTAPFRYPHYHQASDTPDKLDYALLAQVAAGIERVVTALANPQ